MSGWDRLIVLMGLTGWLLLASTATVPALLAKSRETNDTGPTAETVLADLADGAYQFCTEPDPEDWRDGAGVCLNVVKQGTTVEGYYGYPHSDSFVCLRGEVSENWLQGEGLVIAWAGHPWADIPQAEFTWDLEGRLSLSQGDVIRSEGMGEEQTRWIIFRQARLNMQGLYRYPEPRMKPPTQLCDWPLTDGEVCDDESCRHYDEGSSYHSQLSDGRRGRQADAAARGAGGDCGAKP